MQNYFRPQYSLASKGGLSGFLSVVTPDTLLLDTFSTAGAGYSTRKIRSGYTGPAIKVRRSSDNTELDIGFTGNDLDTTALLAFCGAGSGFVSTWYDQSVNARHLTQVTTANQPRIVNAGVLDTINSKPAIVSDGSNDLLTGNAAARTLTNGIAGFTSFILGGWVAYGGADTYALSYSVGGATGARIGVAAGTTGTRRVLARRSDADAASSVTSASTFSVGSEALVSIVDFSTATGRARILRNNVQILAYTNFSGHAAASATSATDSNVVQAFATNSALNSNFKVAERIDFPSVLSDDNISLLTIDSAAYYGVTI